MVRYNQAEISGRGIVNPYESPRGIETQRRGWLRTAWRACCFSMALAVNLCIALSVVGFLVIALAIATPAKMPRENAIPVWYLAVLIATVVYAWIADRCCRWVWKRRRRMTS
jgi:hypothetical protein